jgi:hypothetical protein
LDRLGDILVDSKTACFAWAFMTNHTFIYYCGQATLLLPR